MRSARWKSLFTGKTARSHAEAQRIKAEHQVRERAVRAQLEETQRALDTERISKNMVLDKIERLHMELLGKQNLLRVTDESREEARKATAYACDQAFELQQQLEAAQQTLARYQEAIESMIIQKWSSEDDAVTILKERYSFMTGLLEGRF